MTVDDLVYSFSTTPFLFIGSGITRRYLNLPNWKDLLKHFAKEVKENDFAYSYYENRAIAMNCLTGIMPKIAELIQRDYDEKWFLDAIIRTVDADVLKEIQDNSLSPFKAEIAAYIKRKSIVNLKYSEEIELLTKISEKSISGIITTNYDSFLEDHFQGFVKYLGQTELIFSAIQGVGEIYKIHGSVEKPNSIIINEEDYVLFEQKSTYLAAKLMTIFMEYPIIFMGYSISDNNIQKIIQSIINCLDEEQLLKLQERFVFVEYKKDMIGAEVLPFTIMIDGKPLNMQKIVLEDFKLLYSALEKKKSKLPVRLLRRFKQELYDFTLTNMPTGNLHVALLDDSRVADEDMVLAIGKMSDFGLKGLSGISGDEWYRNIIIGDLDFSADDLLTYAFPKLIKQNSQKLPVNKYLTEATQEFPECRKFVENQDFESMISNTNKKNRKYLGNYHSVRQIWNQEKASLRKATRLIGYLKENQIDVLELEEILKELFLQDMNLFEHIDSSEKSNIRLLIRIYDYLKWGKTKEPSN